MSSRTRRDIAQALVESALVLPLMLTLSLGVLQVVLYAHARDVLTSAAQEGARLAAEDGRGLDEGYARARALIAAGLGSSVDPVRLDGGADDELVAVHIDAALRPILPLPMVHDLPISAVGRVARIEQVMPPGLLRVQHGHETVVLRPAGAVAATLAELDGDAHAVVGRLVSFDDQLGLAFELFGDPDRQELVLREYPTVRQSDLVLGPRTARMLEHLVLLPVRHPELARRYGVDVARFCIFAGPPGVGKTHAGRWLAAELGLPLFLISGGDIASEWYSVTEARLRARIAAAAREPAGGLVFWDEAESMLIERGRSLVGVEDRVVATLLAATDGFAPRGNVLVVLTTNRPDKMDVALRRSLRAVTIPFERPDARATRALFRLYLRDVSSAGDDPEPLAQAATRAVFAEREPIGLAVLRDGSRVPLARAAAISGALVRASCEEASRRAFVREARGEADGSAGVLRDDLLGALADELAAVAGTLTAANLAHALTLPPGVADQVVAVEQPVAANRHLYVADN